MNLDYAGDGHNPPFKIEALNRKVGWVQRDWSKETKDTGVGNPKKSTAEKGKQYMDVVIPKIASMLNEISKKPLY